MVILRLTPFVVLPAMSHTQNVVAVGSAAVVGRHDAAKTLRQPYEAAAYSENAHAAKNTRAEDRMRVITM